MYSLYKHADTIKFLAGCGFIFAALGLECIRPVKKLKNQTQQSAEDTALIQKVGNTRIVIDQVNAGAKMSGRYFNGVVPISAVRSGSFTVAKLLFDADFPSFFHQWCAYLAQW
mmetsp:Transcript_5450/g.8959  ORF Transcript_5450/g.8959 Transcript_5450/m.8959 type:complete len:113 (-) Transcript_5450:215-553(-)